MRLDYKRASALTIIACAVILSGAKSGQNCQPAAPANCHPDPCNLCYCLGPENQAINPPLRPYTCDGDWVVTVAGLYWTSHQFGMEYAIETETNSSLVANRTKLVHAEYKNPDFKWDFGFKVGIGYNTTCDGWDFGALWTWYRGKAFSHNEAESEDNITLLTLWSNFPHTNGELDILPNFPIYATDIQSHWKLDLNLIDVELGREFWSGKRVSLRPFVGIRAGFINQNFDIEQKGGSFNITYLINLQEITLPFNNEINMSNDFKGAGVRVGINSAWILGCGLGIYGNFAYSILYGRFDIKQKEGNRLAIPPFDKQKFFETTDHFRTSSQITDLTLGIQWSAFLCDCKYGITAQLGWENHLFINQNQLWRVTRNFFLELDGESALNYSNSFSQTRGDLSTQGWTLTFRFDF